MADVVEKDDINEAMRLMEMSKDSLNAEERQKKYATFIYLLPLLDLFLSSYDLSSYPLYNISNLYYTVTNIQALFILL